MLPRSSKKVSVDWFLVFSNGLVQGPPGDSGLEETGPTTPTDRTLGVLPQQVARFPATRGRLLRPDLPCVLGGPNPYPPVDFWFASTSA